MMPNNDKILLDYFLKYTLEHGASRFMTQPLGERADSVKTWSFNEALSDAKQVAAFIRSLNLPAKSQIAICSKNSAYWIIVDLAIWMSGHVSVPLYPSMSIETTRYILEHSESKLLFVGKLDEKVWEEMKTGVTSTILTVALPLSPKNHGCEKTWDDIITHKPIEAMIKRTKDELATIIYTSGSTGRPKGVMTSFGAMTVATKGVADMFNVTGKDRYLSFLPMSHALERWIGECVSLYCGRELFFADTLDTFLEDMQRCKPTVFIAVPRLWTKFQTGIFAKIPPQKLNKLLKIPIINGIVRKKILSGLGLDQCRVAGSGSAPIPAAVINWYRTVGLNLLEGYGMTEDFGYSHMSREGRSRVGYVGEPYSEVRQRIAADGEIQVLSPAVMMGYFKNDNATSEALTSDGWLRTGDQGVLDHMGRLKITGRTKEIFKTSKGKYVAPAPIENLFLSHHKVELSCVSGRAHPQPYCIIQLSEEAKKMASRSSKERSKIERELEDYMKIINSRLEKHENLQFMVIVRDDWLTENGFLTPTLKIKRSAIENAYEPHAEGWYALKRSVVWESSWESQDETQIRIEDDSTNAGSNKKTRMELDKTIDEFDQEEEIDC